MKLTVKHNFHRVDTQSSFTGFSDSFSDGRSHGCPKINGLQQEFHPAHPSTDFRSCHGITIERANTLKNRSRCSNKKQSIVGHRQGAFSDRSITGQTSCFRPPQPGGSSRRTTGLKLAQVKQKPENTYCVCCSSNGLRVKSSRRDWNHDISAVVALMIGLFVSVQPRSPPVRRAAFTAASDFTTCKLRDKSGSKLKPLEKLKESFLSPKQRFVCAGIFNVGFVIHPKIKLLSYIVIRSEIFQATF